MKSIRNICRILLGLVFLVSGTLKAIDPLGTAYKFNDYFIALHMDFFIPYALLLAVLMNIAEFGVGFALVSGYKIKLSSLGALLFMLIFTPLTLWLALTNAVSDCGCFGDAIKLSNWGTFYKNILFLAMALFVFANNNKYEKSKTGDILQWAVLLIGALLPLLLQVYTLKHLPLVDFRPWKVGNYIPDRMEEVPPTVDYTFIYKNKATGELHKWKTAELTSIPNLAEDYEYVDREENILKEGIPAEINGFVLEDAEGNDVLGDVIENDRYQFIVFAYDLSKTDMEALAKMEAFAKECAKADIDICLVTASQAEAKQLMEEGKLSMPVYYGDATPLKTPVRANPGLLLMKDGYVLGKWNCQNEINITLAPAEVRINGKLAQSPQQKLSE